MQDRAQPPFDDQPGDQANDQRSDDELVAAARAAGEKAYSPYSKIRVGAAILSADGRLFTGCNVENASYGLTICAERTALTRAVSEGVREFVALAVVGSLEQPMLPCGACRQCLVEFASELRVLLEGQDGTRIDTDIARLLPEAFVPPPELKSD